ncbi:MAG: ATP-binding cassette domain-containing protein [Gemmatimonadaceae bacterium]
MAAITFDAVSKVFDTGTTAVDALTLEIPEGQFSVLVGPSGCGKTTALRMIAGLETPTSGRIYIGERDITELPPRDRDVAMVFQNYALYPHLTVLENITFGLRMRRMPADEANRRARAAAESLGIQEQLERRPAQLSGGQRQRVALARAIVREPAVFLFDEPLSNLDAQIRAQTRAELVRLQRRLGATVLYVTHDQVEAMTMAARVAVMNGGRLEQVAAPLEIYQRPATLFVASFVGSPSINRFAGSVRHTEAGRRFEARLRCR